MTHKFEEKLNSGKAVLLAFLHAGKQDAVDVKYILKELSDKYGDKLETIKVDGSYDHELLRKYKVDTFPTWILIKNGEQLWNGNGIKKVETIDESINAFI
ncbi:MAG: thioredoxin family protein [Bacteroidales bacterium]|nr:thioredoxin family protein [Bacteroidales bacterium]MDE7465235.1 thioredoxin family protein [Muribaculaceae bacterium]